MSGLQVGRNRVFLIKKCFPFAFILVRRPKDAVPVIRGTSLRRGVHCGSATHGQYMGSLSFVCQASSSGPQQDKSTKSSGTSCWRSIEFVANVLCSLLASPVYVMVRLAENFNAHFDRARVAAVKRVRNPS